MSVRKLAVADADKANLLVLHESGMGCCPGSLETCKYVATPDGANVLENVTAITLEIDGVNQTFTFASVNTPKDVRIAIAEVLRANGYDPYYQDNYRGVQAPADEVHIIGEVIPVSVVIDGNTRTFEKRCTMAGIYSYMFSIPLDTEVGDLTIDGVAGTAIGGPGGVATGQAPAFKGAIETALDTDGVVYNLVKVTEVASGGYTVYIDLSGQAEISLGIYDGTLKRSYPDFVV